MREDDFCIFCQEKTHFLMNTDQRDGSEIYCTSCPAGHEYCLTKELFTKMVKEGGSKEHKIDHAQYEEYDKVIKETFLNHRIVLGRDFHLNRS